VSQGKSIRRRICTLLVCGIFPGIVAIGQTAQTDVQHTPVGLSFVRTFSSADDVKRQHPILDLTLDIIAGSKEAATPTDALRSPSGVVTDSNHHIFVADPGAKAVHVFDFTRAKYGLLDGGSDRLGSPFALAVDGHDNLYVIDQSSKTVLIYDAAGKFRGYLGKLRGGESYFDSPTGIAIDKTTGRIYVCDKRRHMLIIMDERGRLISKIGTRGGGNRPGDFRLPTQVAVGGGEVFVLDAGNTRIQIFDTAGHFRRTISLVDTDNRSGLAVDSQGDVYVTESVLNQIQVFGHDGQRLFTFDPSTIQGANLTRSSGLWVDAGDCLYVVDYQSNLVGLFQIGGQNARQCR
jgi:DNA-binding beta-propeller fold protein YncE